MGLFGKKEHLVAEHLPWACQVRPGIILTTTGVLLTSWQYQGPDLESLQDETIAVRANQHNHILQRYGYHWGIHWNARRHPVREYPTSTWPEVVSQLIDAERQALFMDGEQHFATRTHVTLMLLAPQDKRQHLWHHLYEHAQAQTQTPYTVILEGFAEEAERFEQLMRPLFLRMTRCDPDAMATFLHSCCSTNDHPVKMPRSTAFLSHKLADQTIRGGEELLVDEHIHMRVISIKTWPRTDTEVDLWHGVMGLLDELPIEYRYAERAVFIDKAQALRETRRTQRRWLLKRKTLKTMVMEEVLKRESPIQEPEAGNLAADAVMAAEDVASGRTSQCDLTAHIFVWDTDLHRVKEKVTLVMRTLDGEGFVTHCEREHSITAWEWSQPGNLYGKIRTPDMGTDNATDIAPLAAVGRGTQWNAHLGGPCLCYATVGESTPYWVNLHKQDKSVVTVIGPAGAGKDTLLWFLAAQFRRYGPQAQVFGFDKGHGSRAMTHALGGTYETVLGPESKPGQPLARINEALERVWALQWLQDCLTLSGMGHTPAHADKLWEALDALSRRSPRLRTMTGLTTLVQDPELRLALKPYTHQGAYGKFFDGDQDLHATAQWHIMAMDEALKLPMVVPALMKYRFHCLEQRLYHGYPTFLIYNEFGQLLDHDIMQKEIPNQATQLRKWNVSMVLANQSINKVVVNLTGVLENEISHRVFLPNVHAIEDGLDSIGSYYARWGMNPIQRQRIAHAIPKKDYYLVTDDGAQMIDLTLGPVALAFAGAGSREDQFTIDALLAEGVAPGPAFAEAWLRYKHLGWAAEGLRALRQDPRPQTLHTAVQHRHTPNGKGHHDSASMRPLVQRSTPVLVTSDGGAPDGGVDPDSRDGCGAYRQKCFDGSADSAE